MPPTVSLGAWALPPRLMVKPWAMGSRVGCESVTVVTPFAIVGVAAMVVRAPGYLAFGWLRVKLVLVGVLVAYHAWCYGLMGALRAGRSVHSERWYRYFNELPSLLLIAIVVLAVVKPF